VIYFSNRATRKKISKDAYTHRSRTWYLIAGEEFGFKDHIVPYFHFKGIRIYHPKACHFGIRMILS